MASLTLFSNRYPLMAFFGLVFGLEWLATPLAFVSPAWLPFILTFIPAVAALWVVRLSEGGAGVRALVSKLFIWRVGLSWYAAALTLPVLVGLVCMGLAWLLGSATATLIGAFTAFRLLMFVFAAGEELGWRGYALPKLQRQFGPLIASLVLGCLWFAFHLPLFLPGQFFAGMPLTALLLLMVGSSVVYTWLLNHTRGSVLIASLLHGSMNAFGILYAGLSAWQGVWLPALIWSFVALVVIAVTKGKLGGQSVSEEGSANVQAAKV